MLGVSNRIRVYFRNILSTASMANGRADAGGAGSQRQRSLVGVRATGEGDPRFRRWQWRGNEKCLQWADRCHGQVKLDQIGNNQEQTASRSPEKGCTLSATSHSTPRSPVGHFLAVRDFRGFQRCREMKELNLSPAH